MRAATPAPDFAEWTASGPARPAVPAADAPTQPPILLRRRRAFVPTENAAHFDHVTLPLRWRPALPCVCSCSATAARAASSTGIIHNDGAREQELTYPPAAAFVRAALDLARRRIIPEWRGRYMAIGVAAQFELALRQKDIIGIWTVTSGGPFTWSTQNSRATRLRYAPALPRLDTRFGLRQQAAPSGPRFNGR